MNFNSKLTIFLLLLLCFSATCQTANAGIGFFGKSEKLHTIQKLSGLPGSTEYFLCYKTSSYFFIAGLYLKNDGYVLQEGGDNSKYIPLSESQIVEFQALGILPDPLPNYSIPLSEYIIGYSLWCFLIVFSILSYVGETIKRVLNQASDNKLINQLLTNPDYQIALKIVQAQGMNPAIDYLCSKGIPLQTAQENIKKLCLGKTKG